MTQPPRSGARHHLIRPRTVRSSATHAFDKDRGFGKNRAAEPQQHGAVDVVVAGRRSLAHLRAEKSKTLIIQNVLTGKIENRFPLQTVDNPESPNISPDGRSVLFSGLRTAIGDIFKLDIASGDITNLTNDDFADYAPIHSPDGSFIVYMARVSGSQKLFRLDADGKKTQLTFGTQDEASAKVLNTDTIVFSSTATDPATPLTPEEAQRQHLQPVVAQPEKWRTEAVHRLTGRSTVTGRAGEGRPGAAPCVRRLLQGRLYAAQLRSQGTAAHGGVVRLRLAWPHHRLPGAAPAHTDR
jgi:hypothetical protein